MYNKKYVGLTAVVFVIGFLLLGTLFWGCSSDSTSSTIVQGNLDDPLFTAIRADLDDAVDSILANIHAPLDNRWGFPLDSTNWQDEQDEWWFGPLNPDDTADYEYSDDGWHTLYVVHLTASGSQVFYDSVGFFVNGSPWMMYTTDVDEVKYRGSYQVDDDEGGETLTLNYTTRVDVNNVNTTQADANGTALVGVTSEYTEGASSVVEVFDFDVSFEELKFNRIATDNWDTYSGVEGEADVVLTYSAETTTGDNVVALDQDWTIKITFEGNVAHIDATLENTRWSYDHNIQ